MLGVVGRGDSDARPALEEDEERPLAAVLRRDLAREDRDRLAVGPRVVERNRELVVGDHEPVDLARRRHAGFLLQFEMQASV